MHLRASHEIQEGEERRKISLLGLYKLSNLLLPDVCWDVDDAQLVGFRRALESAVLLDVCGDVDDAQLVGTVLDNGRNLIARRLCVLIARNHA